VQIMGLPYARTYPQPRGTIPWQNSQPVFGNSGPASQSMYNSCMGTPVASSNQYNSQLTYPFHPRENQYEGSVGNHIFPAMHNLPNGAAFSSQSGYIPGTEFYMSQPFQGSGHQNPIPRMQNQGTSYEGVREQGLNGAVPPAALGQGGAPVFVQAARDVRGVRGAASTDNQSVTVAPGTTLGRSAVLNTSSAQPRARGGTLRDQHNSMVEDLTPTQNNNNPPLLSSNSSKLSPPCTLSQRKQLRVEEKSYLKEVKRSIAEGRVPQVRLQQNSSGDIVQYKAQFLNALKLAALAIVPHADIDIKNHYTMQEIMKEVRRQFVIEKPLPEGMVAGYLQRLYKRNRAVYHRHWVGGGDESRPDDCPSAAWSQLVDYWKSKEGHKECERNKANASAKKCATVRISALPLTMQIAI
jgi:hypothetical protein